MSSTRLLPTVLKNTQSRTIDTDELSIRVLDAAGGVTSIVSTQVPSGNYTTLYNSIVQTVYKFAEISEVYSINVNEVRNGTNTWYCNISALQIKINKKYSTSKIKITIIMNFETDYAAAHDAVVNIFRSPDNIYIADPAAPDNLRNYGLICPWYSDPDVYSTMQRIQITIMDFSANKADTEYTYTPRFRLRIGGDQVFKLNLPIGTPNPSFPQYWENCTSSIIVEEIL